MLSKIVHRWSRLLLGAAAASLLFSGMAAAETWKFASAAQRGSSLYGTLEDFVARFNEAFKADGLSIELIFVGSEQEAMQQVTRGRLDIASLSFAGSSVVIPENGLTNMPYLYSSNEERIFVTDNHAIPVLKKAAEDKGLVLITWADVGWNDVVCKAPCLTVDSLKGIKARVSPVSRAFWQAMGANGVQMPLSELFPAMEQGLVEAADLPFPYYVTTPAKQSAPHYVTTQHLHHASAYFVNRNSWDKLSEAQQKTLVEIAPKPVDTRPLVAKDEQLPDGALAQKFIAEGGTIHILTPEQRQPFIDAVLPLQEQIVTDAEPNAPRARELWTAIQEGKKAFAAQK